MVNEYSDLTSMQRTMVLNAQTRSVHDDVHDIVDSDPHFVVDPVTRKIIKHTEKSVLILGDHDSERFTFELPRYIQGHDMTLCNEITLNYLDGTKPGVYEIDDLTASDDETVTMTWLISSNVTQEIGKIHFGITFECIREGKVTYKWQTDINSDLSVTNGLNNTNTVIAKNEDILEQWRQKLFGVSGVYEEQLRDLKSTSVTEKLAIQTTGKNQVANVTNEGTKQIQVVENKGTATLATIPEDYTALNSSLNDLNDLMHTKAPAIVEEATSGTEITVKDSAEGMRLQGMKVYGKSWQKTTIGKNLFGGKAFADKIVELGGTLNESNKTVTIEARDIDGKTLFDFPDDSKRYTVILNSYNTNQEEYDKVNLKVVYDREKGEVDKVLNTGNLENKMVAYSTAEGYHPQRLEGGWYTASTVFRYDECGIFEGVLTAEDFEPYTGGKPSPSPDYPQEIESVGRVLSTGKNLFDFSKLNVDYGINANDKTITISAKTNNVGYYNSLKELCPSIQAGKTYVLNAKTSNPEALRIVHLVNADIDFVFEKAFTPTEEQINDKIAFYNHPETEKENVISEIQLEEGSIATAYEPYTGGVPALYQKDIEVELTGKNIINADEYYSKFKQSDGTYKGTTEVVHNVQIKATSDMIGKTYTISVEITVPAEVTYNVIQCVVNAVSNFSNQVRGGNSGKMIVKFTPTSVDDYFCITYGSGSGVLITFYNFQLEEGSVATEYEPYKYQSLPIKTPTGLPAIPVPSGTSGITYTDADGQAWIADEIDFARGKYIRRVWQAEFDGSKDEKWSRYSARTGWMLSDELPENMKARAGFCNEKKVGILDDDAIQLGSKSTDDNKMFYPNSKYYDTSLSDYGLSNWKAHLAEHPLKVMTHLDNPIETDLSEAQIQAYKAVHTNKPTTIISNDADAWMDASYAADTKIWIENKIKEISKV